MISPVHLGRALFGYSYFSFFLIDDKGEILRQEYYDRFDNVYLAKHLLILVFFSLYYQFVAAF